MPILKYRQVVYRVIRNGNVGVSYSAQAAAEDYMRIIRAFPGERPIIEETTEITTKEFKRRRLTPGQLEEAAKTAKKRY